LGNPPLAELGASERVSRDSAANAKMKALRTKQGPSFCYEKLAATEVDGERASTFGQERTAHELRCDRILPIDLQAGFVNTFPGVEDS
jgi:hypothetical protein